MADVVLDAGALIAVERGSRRIAALLDAVARSGGTVLVPAGALAQLWRDGARQARLGRFLRVVAVVVVPLDEQMSRAAAGSLAGLLHAGASVVVLITASSDGARRWVGTRRAGRR